MRFRNFLFGCGIAKDFWCYYYAVDSFPLFPRFQFISGVIITDLKRIRWMLLCLLNVQSKKMKWNKKEIQEAFNLWTHRSFSYYYLSGNSGSLRNVHGKLNASWKISSLAVNGQSFLVIDGYLWAKMLMLIMFLKVILEYNSPFLSSFQIYLWIASKGLWDSINSRFLFG